jgi:hypothetical protein
MSVRAGKHSESLKTKWWAGTGLNRRHQDFRPAPPFGLRAPFDVISSNPRVYAGFAPGIATDENCSRRMERGKCGVSHPASGLAVVGGACVRVLESPPEKPGVRAVPGFRFPEPGGGSLRHERIEIRAEGPFADPGLGDLSLGRDPDDP